jgi:hypothetical protein
MKVHKWFRLEKEQLSFKFNLCIYWNPWGIIFESEILLISFGFFIYNENEKSTY